MATDPEVRQYLRRLRFQRRLEGPRIDFRPRVHAPTVLQKIFKQRNQKRSTYYITSRCQPADQAQEEDEEPRRAKPFWVPPAKHFAAFVSHQKDKDRKDRKKELALPVQKKNNARTRLTADLLRRLHIPEDPPPAEKTMVDMDPEFYAVVEGRPNRDRASVREYIDHIRDLVRVRLKIGYNEDECVLVDEQFRLEQKRLDEILAQQRQYVELFDQFLAEDHAASMELLKKADKAAKLSAEKDAEIKVWICTLGLTRTKVYQLDEKWREARSLQKFLYLVSPMSWRREHDHLNGVVPTEAQEGGSDTSVDAKSSVTQATQATQATTSTRLHPPLDRAASLQEIIDTFLEETRASHQPELYFTEPEQLVKVFRSLAAQSLASLVHIEQLRLPLESLQAGVEQAKRRVEQELSVLQEQVEDLEKEISWEEQRVVQLKQNADAILAVVYHDMVSGAGSANVLALHVWVEEVYEKCVAPNDTHLSAFQMMCAVERAVAAELLALDDLDQKHVKSARKEVYKVEKEKMKGASFSQKKLQHLEQLVYRMERALEPPPPPGRHRLVFRSRPPEARKPPPSPPPQLSEEELDRRAFFTDCVATDRLRSLTSPVPKIIASLSSKEDPHRAE